MFVHELIALLQKHPARAVVRIFDPATEDRAPVAGATTKSAEVDGSVERVLDLYSA